MVVLCKCNCLLIKERRIGHLDGYLQSVLMRQPLLCFEDIKRLRKERLVPNILLFPLSRYCCGILRNHLRAMDNVHNKFVHLFVPPLYNMPLYYSMADY